MDKIKVLIVEDKLLIAEDIAARLRKHQMDVINVCTSAEESLDILRSEKVDLILMDIELSGAMDGISAAHIIHEQYAIPLIFLSDFSDSKTVDRAKKTQPANYLTKPFNEPDLIRAIDLAFSNANTKENKPAATKRNFIFLRTQNQVYQKFMLDDILYLQADRSYCTVMTSSGEYVLTVNMSKVEQQLDEEDFIRVHRSYIVNVNRINAIDGNVLKIRDHQIQIGPDYREVLMKAIKIVK